MPDSDYTARVVRANGYALLSACYYPPDKRLLGTLKGTRGPGSPFRDDLRASIRGSANIAALKQDYVRLFVGPFNTLAPPCGSAYLESDARPMGNSAADVTAWYREDGLENALREPPDHVIAELQYLHFLAINAVGAMRDGGPEKAAYYAERGKRFLAAHLARWVPPFTCAVATSAETEFYRCLAKVTRSFIDEAVGAEEPVWYYGMTVA